VFPVPVDRTARFRFSNDPCLYVGSDSLRPQQMLAPHPTPPGDRFSSSVHWSFCVLGFALLEMNPTRRLTYHRLLDGYPYGFFPHSGGPTTFGCGRTGSSLDHLPLFVPLLVGELPTFGPLPFLVTVAWAGFAPLLHPPHSAVDVIVFLTLCVSPLFWFQAR